MSNAFRSLFVCGVLSLVASLGMSEESPRHEGGNDSTDAILIVGNYFVDPGTTMGKGDDAKFWPCLTNGSDNAEDAWYRLVVTNPIVLTIWTTCESAGPPSYDTRLAILDESLNMISCNDDATDCGAPYYQSEISDHPLGIGTYFIVIDGYSGDAGPYEFNASLFTSSGGCETGSDHTNPESILSLPFMTAGTTVDACHNFEIDCELGSAISAPDYWYTITVDTFVVMDVSTTCEVAGIDTRLAILDVARTVMYCNDDDPACAQGGKSRIEGAFLEPGEYYVVVEGADTTSGTYTINVDTTHTDFNGGLIVAPDIIVRENDLYDNEIDTTSVAGRTLLRLSNGTANIGDGKLYLYGTGVDNGDGTENVIQRVWRTNGTTYDRTAGLFLFHNEHNHIHVEDWCDYSLREILPGDGVGTLLAKSTKTSFCIVDLVVDNPALPGFDPEGQFLSCGTSIQGLSVGWADVYSKSLPGQVIDVTDVPDGTYWLESCVDPLSYILESDETNNITRIKVTLGSGSTIVPDGYEPNEDTPVVDARPPGGPNSPNLGPCGPQKVLTTLTLHETGNKDHYKFYSNDIGSPADFVEIAFDTAQGHLDLCLLDSTGTKIDSSVTQDPVETISLDGRPEGWYYVLVEGSNGDRSPNYQLTIDPPENQSPVDSVTAPSPGTEYIVHAQDTYTVRWTGYDPDGDDTWVLVYANTSPALDGNEVLLSVTGYTDADLGALVVNTAYLNVGTYWFYVEITDGGTKTGDWSDGTVNLLDAASDVGDRPLQVHASRLHPAMPSPFNGHTMLNLDLATSGNVRWRIFDVRGRLVRELANGTLPAGTHNRAWDGTDRFGRGLPSGIYFQSVVGPDVRLTGKLVLLR